MPKKGSRTIEVAGVRYRYIISDSGPQTIRLAVELASDPGRVLSLSVPFRDPWLDLGDDDAQPEDPLTSARVTQVIAQALSLGWRADVKGQAFSCAIDESGRLITTR